jgi:MFS transporter, putative metabolite:H+ symporter
LAAPVGPLLGLMIADRFERKHVLVVVSLAIIVCGLAFSQANGAMAIVLLGACLTLGNNMMSYTYHAYQQELFPTGIRARAVRFVYSWSRFSAIFTGFAIAFVLQHSGVAGVFVFIAGAMLVALLAAALMGPRTVISLLSRSRTERRAEERCGSPSSSWRGRFSPTRADL